MKNALKMIAPMVMTDAKLTASNVSETDETEWTTTGIFDTGDLCMVTTTANGASVATHMIYESQEDANEDNDPSDQALNAAKWIPVRATMRWRGHDGKIADQCTNAGSITQQITPGENVNAMAFFNLSASTVQVIYTDPIEGEVFNKTINLDDVSMIDGYWDWCHQPIAKTSEAAFWDLPNYPEAVIDIIIDAGAGTAKCGEIVMGYQYTIGAAEFGTTVGIENFSTFNRDIYGGWDIVKRGVAGAVNFRVVLDTTRVAPVRNFLSKFGETATVWTGNSEGDSFGTLIYGLYQFTDVNLQGATQSRCSIRVRGMT